MILLLCSSDWNFKWKFILEESENSNCKSLLYLVKNELYKKFPISISAQSSTRVSSAWIHHYPCLHCARTTVEKSGDFVISWIHEIDFCNLLNSWLRNFQVSSIFKKSSYQDSNLDPITCQARTLTIALWGLLRKLHMFYNHYIPTFRFFGRKGRAVRIGGGGGTVCSNGIYIDICNQCQVQQYKLCLDAFP